MHRVFRVSSAAAALLFVASLTLSAQAPARGQGPGRGQAVQLPEGAGKQIVSTTCTACHPANMITNAGYDHEDWKNLINTMVRLPEAQLNTVTDYLAANFPEKPERRPTLVSGDLQISFKEWVVPTLGQRSRDPIQLKNGMMYWTGQYGSLVGELNPQTGAMREFKLPADVRPHSIVADRDGNIWYMGNGNGTVGKINAKTGETMAVYRMPVPNAHDPHTGEFDQKGILWFSLQQSNMVGRLDPSTGDIKLVTMPTPDARPYGVKIDSKGAPWIAYNGANKVATIDPVTMTVRELATPTPQSRIRRLALLRDDTIFYVDSARGTLGKMDPKSGFVKEWASPSGPRSHPYAIEVIDDVVWYNESNQRPDALVRFDPRTEKFQSWAIPSGYGIIRHMRATPDGNLAIHQSMSNRIGLVTIPRGGRAVTQ